MKAIEVLESKLVGSFITRFSVGDTWDLHIDGYWLVAQEIVANDEARLKELLAANYPPYGSAVDKEYIGKCAIVAAAMRRKIIGLALDDSGGLEISFAGDFKLLLSTGTDVVDWQWALNETGQDPYLDYVVACFWKGEVVVNGA